MTQTATDGKTGPRENPQFCAALEQQLSIKKRSNFVLSPRKIISISAAQECKNLFRAATNCRIVSVLLNNIEMTKS